MRALRNSAFFPCLTRPTMIVAACTRRSPAPFGFCNSKCPRLIASSKTVTNKGAPGSEKMTGGR